MIPSLDHIFHFLKICASMQDNLTEDLCKHIVGLIGDLAVAFGKKVQPYLRDPSIISVVQMATSSGDSDLETLGKWAHSVIATAMNTK